MIIDKKEERLRNANAYFRIKSAGQSFSDFFDIDDEIIIYGFAGLGKTLCRELLGKRNVIGIIDKGASGGDFIGIPVYSLEDAKRKLFSDAQRGMTIIVTNTAFWYEIRNDLSKVISDRVKVYPFCAICALLEIEAYVHEEPEYSTLKNLILNHDSVDINYIVIVNSTYSLLIYLLFKGECRNTLFLIHTFKLTESMINMIHKLGGICVAAGGCQKDGFYDIDLKVDIIRVAKYYAKDHNAAVYGQDFFSYVMDYFDCDLTIIEDGFVSAYTPEEHKEKYQSIYNALEGKVCFAHYSEVRKELFIHEYSMPDEYKEKAVIIDLRKRWYQIEDVKKEVILNGFLFSKDIESSIRKANRRILVVASNYAGNSMCDEDTEICMFKEVLSHYDEETVAIKTHPMSRINYKKVFPKAYIIDVAFPIELLMFVDLGIERVVGIASNGLVNLKDFYIIDEYPEIKERFIE